MPFLGQNGTFWPNLARSDEILGISKSGWCKPMKCASWTPETDSRGIWMIWNGFLGLLASGTQKSIFKEITLSEKKQTIFRIFMNIL